MSVETGVAYFEGRARRHILPDLDDMVASGCTYVVHCMSEFDARWQRETVARLVAETKARGMRVWLDPYGVGEVFGGEPFSRFGAVHPDARQLDSTGRPTTRACPNQPAFREWVYRWLDDAATVGAEMIFWDEPTWDVRERGAVWSCRCERCRAGFRERFGAEMPEDYVDEVKAFQELSMAELLGDVCERAHRLGMENAVCIMPPEASNPGFRDWDRAASIRGLDNFGTDPYWFSFLPPGEGSAAAYVGEHARRTVEVADRHGIDHHVWIQAFEVPAGREREIDEAIDAAVAAGARNLAAWSYDGCDAMSSCTSERPEETWAAVARSFRRVRDRA
ncbi:MAG TPA: hypothetical protein VFS32_05030 [Candidatus Limnocylindrales bacterium]|nr:hypothetical protein [Candidatus Limnocylindrales bacterium]